jgi:hypothetical protein
MTDSDSKQIENIKNKIIFVFMPENIVFEKTNKNENIEVSALKNISPFFYWCSAHEFEEFSPENKFLIQYQKFLIENNEIVPDELIQKWHGSKNSVRNELINFIDSWNEHKRVILGHSNIKNFLQFGEYIGKSIFNLKDFYVEEVAKNGYDFLKKDFWKTIALDHINNNTVKNKTKKNNKTKNARPRRSKKL